MWWNSSWPETMIGGFGIESVRERRNGATNGVTFGSLELIDIEQKHLKTKEKCEKGREKRKNGSRLAPVHQSYSRNRWIGEERINRGCFGGGLVGFLVCHRWSEKMEERSLVCVVGSLVV